MRIVTVVRVAVSRARGTSVNCTELLRLGAQMFTDQLFEDLIREIRTIEPHKVDSVTHMLRKVERRPQLLARNYVDSQPDGCGIAQKFAAKMANTPTTDLDMQAGRR